MADTPVPAQYEGGTHRAAHGLGVGRLFVASAAFFVTQPFITHPAIVAGPQFNPAQIQPVLFSAPPQAPAGINRPLVALAAQDAAQLKASVWGAQPPTASPQILHPVISVAEQFGEPRPSVVFKQQPAAAAVASTQVLQPVLWVAGQTPQQPPSSLFSQQAQPVPILPGLVGRWIPSQDPRQIQPVIAAGFFDSPMFWVKPVAASPQASPEQRPSAVFGPMPPTAQTPLIGQINAKPQDSPEQRPSWLQPAFFDQTRAAPPFAQITSLLPDSDARMAFQGYAQTYSATPPDTPASSGVGGGGRPKRRHQIKLGERILEGSQEQIEALAREIALSEPATPDVVEIVVPAKKRKPALTAKTQLAADVLAAYAKAVADEQMRLQEIEDEEALIALLT
jgi:hypothetical protein